MQWNNHIYKNTATVKASAVRYPRVAVSELAAPVAVVVACALFSFPSVVVAIGEGVADPEGVAWGLAATLVEEEEALITGLLGFALTSPLALAMPTTHLITSGLCWTK